MFMFHVSKHIEQAVGWMCSKFMTVMCNKRTVCDDLYESKQGRKRRDIIASRKGVYSRREDISGECKGFMLDGGTEIEKTVD